MKRIILTLVMVAGLSVYAMADPTTITVTLTTRQVEALYSQYGASADLPALVQSHLNDWLHQHVEELKQKERRTLRQAFDDATPETKAQVLALLNLNK